MNIGLDIMGGDFAPDATIEGAVQAVRELSENDRLFLFGPEEVILAKLSEKNEDPGRYTIVNTTEVIGMSEKPIKAFTMKPNSSIAVGFGYLKKGLIDGFASAGNSGAMVVGSMHSTEMIKGIVRPCTASILPKANGGSTFLLDIGTNPDPKPEAMLQFGIIGAYFAKYVFDLEDPRVGLLNIGEEPEKGNILTQATYKLMAENGYFNFIGNVEGRDIITDKADVIVCDGFTGNVVLKLMESLHETLKERGLVDDFVENMNYEIYGGTPILGINSTVIIGHGISGDNAIKKMILLTKTVFDSKLSSKIQGALQKHS